MAVNINDRMTDDGKRFQKLIGDISKLEVRIGIQQGKTSKEGVDLVDIAMFNELGTIHISSRPFLRDSVDSNGDKINNFLKSTKSQIIKGAPAEDIFKKIGVFQKGLIQEQIVSGSFKRNTDATIEKKSKKKTPVMPLIDTGRMRQSINYIIQQKGGPD